MTFNLLTTSWELIPYICASCTLLFLTIFILNYYRLKMLKKDINVGKGSIKQLKITTIIMIFSAIMTIIMIYTSTVVGK